MLLEQYKVHFSLCVLSMSPTLRFNVVVVVVPLYAMSKLVVGAHCSLPTLPPCLDWERDTTTSDKNPST